MDIPLNTQLKNAVVRPTTKELISLLNDNLNFFEWKLWVQHMSDCSWVQHCLFLQKLVLIWKKNKKPLQSQHDITAGPIVCRFTHPPISLPALPFTHWALYHSHTWKSVTSSPNTTSLLFPLALWRQQGSPLLALIYNAVKLIQTCVFMRALISIVCACVYSRGENCQSKMKPWLHFNPEAPSSSEQHRSGEIQSVSISRNAVQRQNTTNFTGNRKELPHIWWVILSALPWLREDGP